jgi:hypothetical protein
MLQRTAQSVPMISAIAIPCCAHDLVIVACRWARPGQCSKRRQFRSRDCEPCAKTRSRGTPANLPAQGCGNMQSSAPDPPLQSVPLGHASRPHLAVARGGNACRFGLGPTRRRCSWSSRQTHASGWLGTLQGPSRRCPPFWSLPRPVRCQWRGQQPARGDRMVRLLVPETAVVGRDAAPSSN